MPSPPPSDPEARAARWISTVGGLGDRLPAAGTTAGSLPAAAVWWALAATVQTPWRVVAITAALTVAAVAAGSWAAGAEALRRGAEDPQPIVIDEVAGQWLTYLASLPFVALGGGLGPAAFAVAGFLLFRLFDIVKPWPVSRLERLAGGIGILADDLAAALYAAIVLAVGWTFIPLPLG